MAGVTVTASPDLVWSSIESEIKRLFELGKHPSLKKDNQRFYWESTTGPMGTFQLGGLPPTSYNLRVKPAHFVSGPDVDLQPNLRKAVELREGEYLRGVVLTFDEGAAVWGTVTDEAGQPIPSQDQL